MGTQEKVYVVLHNDGGTLGRAWYITGIYRTREAAEKTIPKQHSYEFKVQERWLRDE